MAKFSDLVDLRNFTRGKRLGYQTANRIFTNLLDVVVPLLLRKLDDDGKVLGREHDRIRGSYTLSGPNFVLVSQNPDYAFLPATIVPSGTGDLTITFVGAGPGTADYNVTLTAQAATTAAVGKVAVASGGKLPGSLRLLMAVGTTPTNLPGFEIGIGWD